MHPCALHLAGGGEGFVPKVPSAASSGGFQEVEGESEERRRMRFERYQKVQERAVSCVAARIGALGGICSELGATFLSQRLCQSWSHGEGRCCGAGAGRGDSATGVKLKVA